MDARSRFKNFGGRVRERGTPARAAVEARTSAEPIAHATVAHHIKHSEDAHHKSIKTKKVGFLFGRRWMIVVIGLLAAGVVYLGYQYVHTRNELKAAKNPETANQTELERITSTVGKTIKLPNETPTLASVTNISQLKNQEFFKDAQNGDKVLIYTKSGRALLYRPSTKQVIEYARVNLGNQ